jgi:hypothetical protein
MKNNDEVLLAKVQGTVLKVVEGVVGGKKLWKEITESRQARLEQGDMLFAIPETEAWIKLKSLFREKLFSVIINLIIKNDNILEEALNDAKLLEVEKCKPITATTTTSDVTAHTRTPVQSFLSSNRKKEVPWNSKEKEGSVVDLVNQDPAEDGKLVHAAMGRLINTNYFHDNLVDNYNANTNIGKEKEIVTPTQASTQQQGVKPELLTPA